MVIRGDPSCNILKIGVSVLIEEGVEGGSNTIFIITPSPVVSNLICCVNNRVLQLHYNCDKYK